MSTMRISLFKTLAVGTVLAFQSHAATYYVSPSGSNSNAGTSPSAPWATCPGMMATSHPKTLSPGDTVYFDNAGTWTASTGGELLRMSGGVTYDGETWGSGTRAVLRAGVRFTQGVIVYWYKDDPSIPTVLKGFEMDGGSYGVTGIGIGDPWAPASMTGATKRVENCIVHHCGFADELPLTSYGIKVGATGGRQTHNVEILNCKVYTISRTGIAVYPNPSDAANRIHNVLVRGCEVYDTGLVSSSSGWSILMNNHVTDVTVEYNYVHDSKSGIGISVSPDLSLQGPQNCAVRYNLVTGITTSPAVRDQCEAVAPRSYAVYGNLFYRNEEYGYHLQYPSSSCTASIYNNTFFENCADYGSAEVYIGTRASMPSVEFRNNLISAGTGRYALWDNSGGSLAHSHNLFYRPDGGTLVRNGGSSYSASGLAAWESTGLAANPGFKNSANLPTGFSGTYGDNLIPNADGLSLRPDGNAVEEAQTLAASFAGAINLSGQGGGALRTAPWDIGAYELTAVAGGQVPVPPSRLRIAAPGN